MLGPITDAMDRAFERMICTKYRSLSSAFDERPRRLWAGAEARAAGRGGVAAVARATGLAHTTIRRGVQELASGRKIGPRRTRKPGGGRKALTILDTDLVKAMELLVEPATRG